MYPIDLTVPDHEREQALRLGARWDDAAALWQVPRTLNAEPLARWLSAKELINVRARQVWLACVQAPCLHCSTVVPHFGMILPAAHQILVAEEDPSGSHWEITAEPSQLFEVAYLSAALMSALHAHAPTYRLDFSALLGTFCWMNHCARCRSRIEDDDCALEFGSPLHPLDEFSAARFLLREFRVDAKACCLQQSWGVNHLESMARLCI